MTTLLVLSCLLASSAEPEPPNIVFMLSDDHTSQAWGCYGGRLSKFARTPNIDALAHEGVRLRNAFCTNSICVPSRASILTGQYSHRNGVRTLKDRLRPDADHFVKRLRSAGYETALVGKWHLRSLPQGFDHWEVIRGQGRYHGPKLFSEAHPEGKTYRDAYSTDLFTDLALKWLRKRDGKRPFCLLLHFKATHEPWQYHPRHANLYKDVKIPEPKSLHGTTGPVGSVVPGWPLEILTERMRKRSHYGGGKLEVLSEKARDLRSATYQKLVKDFLRCGVAIDENIGRVREYLKESGLERNTIVVYTSDQGYFLGEHNYFDKRFMLEESLRMPTVISYPKEIRPGLVLDDMVLNIDFAPTLLDFAGVSIPASVQGRSFRSNLRGSSPSDWRRSMYYRYFENSERRPAHFGVRTKRYKLVYYSGLKKKPPEARWEFYDLRDDPEENRNRYGEPAYARPIDELKRALTRLQREVGDELPTSTKSESCTGTPGARFTAAGDRGDRGEFRSTECSRSAKHRRPSWSPHSRFRS
ncbi:MAG: sulfatase [Planctomycetota bacterium]